MTFAAVIHKLRAYTHTHTHARIHAPTLARSHARTLARTHARAHPHPRTHAPTHPRTHAPTHARARAPTPTHTYTQIEAESRNELEQELGHHLIKINLALDLTSLGRFLVLARDALERVGPDAQPDISFLHGFIEAGIRDRTLGREIRLPTDFQLRLILAGGFLCSQSSVGSESSPVGMCEASHKLCLNRDDCFITAMRPDAYLKERVNQNGLEDSVHNVREWLRDVLKEYMVRNSGAVDVQALDRIFFADAIERDAAALLQCQLRRLFQRRLIRYFEQQRFTDAVDVSQFRYSFVPDCSVFLPGGTTSLPSAFYWFPREICCVQAVAEIKSVGQVAVTISGRYRAREGNDCSTASTGRVVCMQELVEARGLFQRRLRDLQRLHLYQRSRLEEVGSLRQFLKIPIFRIWCC